jgi:hypothetical protein
MIEAFPFEMNGLHTHATLNLLRLGLYDVMIGVDWLAAHKVKLYCFNKSL